VSNRITTQPDTADELAQIADAVFSRGDIVEIRRIDRTKPAGRNVVCTWHLAEELAELAASLLADNATADIYIGANPRKARGAKGDASVALARTLFADFDHATAAEVEAKLLADGMPAPTLTIATGHGVHCYWRLADEITDLAQWADITRDLIAHIGSDRAVKNPERVMRLPGFVNHKPPQAESSIVECEPTRVYDLAELLERIPKRPEEQTTPRINGNHVEVPATDDGRASRARAYLAKMPAAISGHHGHDAAFNAACELFRFGLSERDAYNEFARFNSRCSPLWSDAEIRHKLADALAEVKSKGEFGSRVVERVAPLEMPPPPPLPVELMIGWHGDFVRALAEATETPPEIAWAVTTAVIATATQGKFEISPERGYVEPICVYFAPLYPPGGRKSAIIRAAIRPLIDYEKTLRASTEPVIKRQQAELAVKTATIKALQAEAAKAEDLDAAASLLDRIAQLQADLPEVMHPPRIFAQDVTPEHLGTMLSQQGERLGIFSDEAGIFGTLLGQRYSRDGGSNLDLVLQAYSASPVCVDRGGRSVSLSSPVLTIAVTPQPGIAKDIALRKENRERGLTSRIQFFAPPSMLGNRTLEHRPIADEVSRTYCEQVQRLLEIPLPIERPRLLTLDADAYQRWKAWQREVENMMREGGKLYSLPDVGGKLPGQTARIAALMHLAMYASVAENMLLVEGNTMGIAIDFARAALEHTVYVLSDSGVTGELLIARRLWDEAKRLNAGIVTARDLWLGVRSLAPSMKDAEPAFTALVERGYLFEMDGDNRRGRPSRRFRVNPAATNIARSALFAQCAVGRDLGRGRGGYVR